ncbi:penicillin-binding protein 1B [Methylotuvimicrobium alcaliphilum]|uniref:Penicillin-binding protein 1B n=1 Tax=Methylotuvimicrobium alcaliphilum (strain DSM 19304 / NCIMB 14124 / VKM B-2133 / 20Z) TaxID=1091494 RepID=G4SX12_META2|nr:penicillin-binding protein 1B [Methylotuvimicrobium alcaliphilum]CCE23067.1 Penicillin-binding protein 1B [Includes: Penicillin-insensitive transglycosylase; Penicillin-sensitive transpeptidase] [Methylotuvimicrobium alcaliphilum 20Z]
MARQPKKSVTPKKTTRKPRKRATRTKSRPERRRFGWFKKILLLGFVFAVFILTSYIGYLDYNVRRQFEGKRWAIPARVYANPEELYAGYRMSIADFEVLLQQLRYRQDSQLSSEGTYYRSGLFINVKTRAFDFWDQSQDSRALQIRFSPGEISDISDLSGRGAVAVARLDPIQIGSFYPTRKEDRVLIKLSETPDTLIQGLLATEDRDFYNHYGISIKAILRAMLANVRAGGIVQGGSTITQQLIKNFYLTSERSFWRKINEVFMSLIIEYRYGKDEILEAYLNEVYLGQDGASAVHGFGLASEFYFGRTLKDLPLAQMATLVALVRGPSYYDPRRHTERALKRRELVLDKMHEQGFITLKQADEAKKQPLEVMPQTHRSANRYPAFMDLVKRQLQQEYKDDDLTSEGLRIFTTLEPRVQNAVEKSLVVKMRELEKNPRANELESAVIVTRREGAEIVAMAGGRDKTSAGFNRALDAVRPIGSLIKPVVYLTALEYPAKYTITTPVSDTRITVKSGKGNWTPKNYDNTEHGEVPLHKALTNSYNLATVRIGMDVGIARVAKTLKDLGVDRPVDLYPSLLLGASPLSPLDVTQMYQTLAGDGFVTPLRAIRGVVDGNGKRLQSYPFNVRQSVDPAATYITNTILQEVMTDGTGRSAYNYLPGDFGLAGKTGTTNELRDSWFAGFSGDYLSVVWVGRDDNKPSGLTGSTGALKIWSDVMKQISSIPVVLTPPDNVDMVWIDPYTGLLANQDCENVRQFPFIRGSAPTSSSPCVQTEVEKAKDWFQDFFKF